MKGLEGARVVLIDDEIREALPVLTAFSKRGVPIAYFDGSPASLPLQSRRLMGVRLAILDINLGMSGSDETKASTLVQNFAALISPSNGPYAVILWTKHSELRDLVTRYIFEHADLPKPVLIKSLKKTQFVDSRTGKFRITKLANNLFKDVAVSSPLECLLTWEKVSFQAATSVTNRVTEKSGPSAEPELSEWQKAWQKDALRMLLAVSKAHAEKRHSRENCISEFFLALNPLHRDRMDFLVDCLDNGLEGHRDGIMSATGDARLEQRARVNSMLHLAEEGLQQFAAGNVYTFPVAGAAGFVPSLRDLLRGAVHGDAAEAKKRTKTLVEKIQRCGVEISPVCDHAQGKLGLAKVAMGFLVPHVHAKWINEKADFMISKGPFFIDWTKRASAGAFTLYLNSRYITAPRTGIMRRLRAKARVRSELLAEIQVWAAYRGSRQGLMLVH
jgi:hypothetical protein